MVSEFDSVFDGELDRRDFLGVAAATAMLSIASLVNDKWEPETPSPQDFTHGYEAITQEEYNGLRAEYDEVDVPYALEGATVRFTLQEGGTTFHTLRVPEFLPKPAAPDGAQASLHVLGMKVDGKTLFKAPLIRTTPELTDGRESAVTVQIGLEKGKHTVVVSDDKAFPLDATAIYQITTPITPHAELTRIFEDTPIVCGRPGTDDHTDTPLMTVAEIDKSGVGKERYTLRRYTAVLSSEVGGTPDGLRAERYGTRKKGRTFDTAGAYDEKEGPDGEFIDARYESAGHHHNRFKGKRIRRQPVVQDDTKNNLFSDQISRPDYYSLQVEVMPPGVTIEEYIQTKHPEIQEVSRLELMRKGRYTENVETAVEAEHPRI